MIIKLTLQSLLLSLFLDSQDNNLCIILLKCFLEIMYFNRIRRLNRHHMTSIASVFLSETFLCEFLLITVVGCSLKGAMVSKVYSTVVCDQVKRECTVSIGEK